MLLPLVFLCSCGEFSLFISTGGDDTRPVVISVSPENGATQVAVNTVVSAAFSDDMNPGSINTDTFTVRDSMGNRSAGTVILTGRTAAFTPLANLSPAATYIAAVTTGVEDTSGNNMASDFTWVFTTVE